MLDHQGEKAIDFAHQAEKLAQLNPEQENGTTGSTQAVEAKFVTAQDPVVETANGGRLPAVPLDEAMKLNQLKDELQGRDPQGPPRAGQRPAKDGTIHGATPEEVVASQQSDAATAPLKDAIPPSKTNPLFPPLPMYGPPTLFRTLQCWFFRASSAVLSVCFLLVIVLGAAFTSIPMMLEHIRIRLMFQNPDRRRPFFEEEERRKKIRAKENRAWEQRKKGMGTRTPSNEKGLLREDEEFPPAEGGPDPLICSIAYYARRVGLDAETFEVQTEDGFIIELWHIFNPREYKSPRSSQHRPHSPELFRTTSKDSCFAETQFSYAPGDKRYPILMMHGLLQSGGAYCSNDDDSLAFFLAKSGYDVWLGNNRCGFNPRHTMLEYEDPRMWAWNIRQMGVMDLPALISRVLAETGFPKLALIAHSQGTTQSLVALAKEQRPDIGAKISVFCALAPAAYAGPLIGKMYFKFMRVVPPSLFRMIFGIHSFIPIMMRAHSLLPGRLYGAMGYRVFSFLFNWSDSKWERALRDRMFQFAPVYVSSESMRWWLGRECFAKQKCILATRDEGRLEDKEDEEDDELIRKYYVDREPHVTERRKLQRNLTSFHCQKLTHQHHDDTRGKFAWYDSQFPPLALWVCGADDLVDGRRLLRRFDRGREPFVRVVHKKIIEGYEHLDVIWAMDMIEKVGKEVREVIWRTVDEEVRADCRVPAGCEGPLGDGGDETPPQQQQQQQSLMSEKRSRTGGAVRMASISEFAPAGTGADVEPKSPTVLDSSKAEKAEQGKEPGVEKDSLEHPDSVDLGEDGLTPLGEPLYTDVEEKGNPLG